MMISSREASDGVQRRLEFESQQFVDSHDEALHGGSGDHKMMDA